jgi:hypothetical protein
LSFTIGSSAGTDQFELSELSDFAARFTPGRQCAQKERRQGGALPAFV